MATAGPSKSKAKGGATTPGSKGAPKRGRTFDDETRARIVQLGREGWSAGRIAREVGCAVSSVTRICAAAEPPVSFKRGQTAAAAEAHAIDLKAARAELSQMAVESVRDLFGRLTAPHEVIHWDRDGFMHRGQIKRPTSGDVKNYAIAIGVLTDKHLALVRHDSDDRDLPAVDKWLEAMLGTTVVAA